MKAVMSHTEPRLAPPLFPYNSKHGGHLFALGIIDGLGYGEAYKTVVSQ